VEEELGATLFPHQEEMIALLEGIPRLELSSEVHTLSARYADELLVPRLQASLDGVHLAVACYHDCDVLLTWNIRHLANPNKVDHLRAVNARLDQSTPKILTPDYLMEPWP
jgi:hypothetical protein